MLKGKKAVIFDLDGTLVDSMGIWGQIDIEYLGAHGYEVPKGLQKEIEGLSFTEVAVYFKERFLIPESIEEIKRTWKEMAEDKYRYEVLLKPGIEKLLPFLRKRGISMAVASSNDRTLIETVLKSHRILEYFQCIITACEVQKGKPAPDVYLEAARRLQVQPGECLVFEDIIPGILSGKAAGMTTCAVEDTYSILQKKEKTKAADYYIVSYEQVMEAAYED